MSAQPLVYLPPTHRHVYESDLGIIRLNGSLLIACKCGHVGAFADKVAR
jgi:hypothetical protein